MGVTTIFHLEYFISLNFKRENEETVRDNCLTHLPVNHLTSHFRMEIFLFIVR